MSKKAVSVILAVCMLFGLCYGTLAEETAPVDKVEISFALGDKVLMINGEAVESECAPYTVGEGVTLVPVRIITEAFGAKVDWEEATQTVTLTYQDVTIQLVIGSGTALVNGNEVELLAPPEINQDRTMVPLRFISENFGADVGWDGSTDRITIVKEASENNGPITNIEEILNHSDKERVGDSYFGWSVQRVPDMQLSYKQSDGFYTVLTSESKHMELFVMIYDLGENSDEISELKQIIKEDSASYTQISMEEKKIGNIPYIHAQYKDKDYYVDDRAYLTDEYVFSVMTYVPADQNAGVFNEAVEVVDTFQFNFDAEITENLSQIGEDGMYLFVDAKMGVLMKLPAGWHSVTDEDIDNEFAFTYIEDKQAVGSGNISVYSISSAGSAEDFANADRNGFLDEFNSEYTTCSDIQTTTIMGLTAYTYTYSFKYEDSVDSTVKRIFLENGDYVYRIGIQLDNGYFEASQFDDILNSFMCVQLDSNEVGKLSPLERSIDEMQTLKNDQGQFWFEIPSFFIVDHNGTASYALDAVSGRDILASMTVISGMPSGATLNIQALAESVISELKNDKNVVSINSKITNVTSGKGIKGVSFTYVEKVSGSRLPYKTTNFIFSYNNEVYMLTVASPITAADSVNEQKIVDHIIETFDFEK